MKLLVFAATPPPVHGQNVMVAAMLAGLRVRADFTVVHVAPQLSRTQADIGRWRPGKVLALLRACATALAARMKHGPMTFYYVPAPAKRAALYRDWAVMLLCRPFFSRLVLHWHAVGLGDWLQHRAMAPERWLTQWLLGGAALSIVLAPELAADAQVLRPRQTAVVPNGIQDPAVGVAALSARESASGTVCELLFLGAGTHEKGLFRTVAAVNTANAQRPGSFRLTFAGSFTSPADETAFSAAAAYSNGAIRHVGFADEKMKRQLFTSSDVFVFPTTYPHEGQPLVLLEALAHGLKIVSTRWRAIPGMLPREGVWLADAEDPADLVYALFAAADAPDCSHTLRRHFLQHYTLAHHLETLAGVFREIDG